METRIDEELEMSAIGCYSGCHSSSATRLKTFSSRCRQPVVAENPAQSRWFRARLSAVSQPAPVCAREAVERGGWSRRGWV